MNLGKLSKRLRKELLANPKQAAVLGIVCLVACWFWSPLFMKWFSGKPKSRSTSQAAVVAETAAPQPENVRPWYDIHRWRQADPLTRPALLAEGVPSPFRVSKPPAVAQQSENLQPAEALRVATTPVEPQKLGLNLEAIVYSGARRVAQINGQTVREGEEFFLGESSSDLAAIQIKGKVVTIDRTEVLLEVAGRSVRLKVQPKLLGRGEVVGRLSPQ